MLVLSRKVGQRIILGVDIEITVVQIRGRRVRLGVTAPREVCVNRLELQKRIQEGHPPQRGRPRNPLETERASHAGSETLGGSARQ
jgi:carbon storage regulator